MWYVCGEVVTYVLSIDFLESEVFYLLNDLTSFTINGYNCNIFTYITYT